MTGSDQPRSYLIESYWPGVTAERLVAAAERVQTATHKLRTQGHELRFLGSILVPVDETVFCLFHGDEADVRSVTEQAGVPYERVLESLRIGGTNERETQ